MSRIYLIYCPWNTSDTDNGWHYHTQSAMYGEGCDAVCLLLQVVLALTYYVVALLFR